MGREILQIAAGHEVLASPDNQHHPQIVAARQFGGGFGEGLHHVHRQGIEGRRAVKGKRRNAIDHVQQNGGSHGAALLGLC